MVAAVADVRSISQRLVIEAGEVDLVEAARQGDDAAFRALYRTHRSEVHRVVYRLIGPTADMEDIVQEVFIQVHRSLGNFRGQAKFSTWLHRVAVNVALQHLRKKKTTIKTRPEDSSATATVEDGGVPTPHEDAETHERLAAVRRALDKLSPKKRAVVVLHDMQGLDAHAIAKIVGAPVFTVRTRLFYGRKELYREILKEPAFAGDISAAELQRSDP
jgi:RNA polymerase sigma-70 factor (ECF subfamily)